MGIFNKYDISQLNTLVTEEDIELELKDLLSDIEYIEKKYNTRLIGERNNFNNARHDLLGLTKAQCVIFFSIWRKGIFSRYGLF